MEREVCGRAGWASSSVRDGSEAAGEGGRAQEPLPFGRLDKGRPALVRPAERRGSREGQANAGWGRQQGGGEARRGRKNSPLERRDSALPIMLEQARPQGRQAETGERGTQPERGRTPQPSAAQPSS